MSDGQEVKWTNERIDKMYDEYVVNGHTARGLVRRISYEVRDDYQTALDEANARIAAQEQRIASLEAGGAWEPDARTWAMVMKFAWAGFESSAQYDHVAETFQRVENWIGNRTAQQQPDSEATP